MAAIVFAGLVAFLSIGFLWFYIARPILEDYGIISVNSNDDAATVVMSRSEDKSAASSRPSLETASQTDRQTEPAMRIKSEQFLTVYRVMREAGIGREAAAAAFKAGDLPFNNNVWRDAEPPPKVAPVEDEPHAFSPIAGRRIDPRLFQSDPDFPYQAPA